jgi:hypothetical protein
MLRSAGLPIAEADLSSVGWTFDKGRKRPAVKANRLISYRGSGCGRCGIAFSLARP